MIGSLILAGSLILMQPGTDEPPAVSPSANLSTPSIQQDAEFRANLERRAWEGQYTADVHVRYHGAMYSHYAFWEWVFTIGVFTLGTVSLVGPLIINERVLKSAKARLWGYVAWATVGAAAFAFAGAVSLSGVSNLLNEHAVAKSDWDSIKKTWERIRRDEATLPLAELKYRVDLVEANQQAVEKSEPTGHDDELLAKCQKQTNDFYGLSDAG